MKIHVSSDVILRMVTFILISLGITLFVNFTSLAGAEASQSVEKNWRTSYDILVRPAQSSPFLDDSGQRLIEPNFLSGQEGGITLEQYESILSIPGIEVAAPISMIGYFPLRYVSFAETVNYQSDAPWSIYKDVRTITINNNLDLYQAQDITYTVYDRRDSYGIDPETGMGGVLISPDGKKYPLPDIGSPESISATKVRVFGKQMSLTRDGQPTGHGFNAMFDLYVLLAGIDPAQEQALVGLQNAVTFGRYIQEGDDPRFENSITWAVPVLVNQNSYRDIEVKVITYGLDVPLQDNLPERLKQEGLAYLERLSGQILQDNSSFSLLESFQTMVQKNISRGGAIGDLGVHFSRFMVPRPVEYLIGAEFEGFPLSLEAIPTRVSLRSPIPAVSLSPAEISYRQEETRPLDYKGTGENASTGFGVALIAVGSFSLEGLPKNLLNQVPMETYFPPSALLRFDEQKIPQEPAVVLPTNNPLGYLSDTPLALTTLESARFLAQRNDFISAVRIRVSGVEQVNESAQTRIETVANEIKARTGLQVDITLGSSPQPVLVHIPGYQDLPGSGYLEEPWIRQLVGITIKRGVNKADLLFFATILLSCCMYAASNAVLQLLRKRKEVGILSALGWRSSDIVRSVLQEAMVASIFAIAISFLLSAGFSFSGLSTISLARAAMAAPLVLFVYLSGAGYAALQSTTEMPVDSISRAGNAPAGPVKRWARWRSIIRRYLPAWLALGLSTGAFLFVLVIFSQLDGLMSGTFLGEAISLRLQPYHYLLVGIALFISGMCILETMMARVMERRLEIGLMKAVGWTNQTIFNHFVQQGLVLALFGGAAGILSGLGVFWMFYASLPQDTLFLSALGLFLPGAIGGLAGIYPAYLAARIDPVEIMQSM